MGKDTVITCEKALQRFEYYALNNANVIGNMAAKYGVTEDFARLTAKEVVNTWQGKLKPHELIWCALLPYFDQWAEAIIKGHLQHYKERLN